MSDTKSDTLNLVTNKKINSEKLTLGLILISHFGSVILVKAVSKELKGYINPKKKPHKLQGFLRVEDGSRTHDLLNHNQAL